MTDCGTHLIVTTEQDCRDNLVFYAPFPTTIDAKIPLTCVISVFEADYEVSLGVEVVSQVFEGLTFLLLDRGLRFVSGWFRLHWIFASFE